MYAQPVHLSAGRWMIFGDRCPSAPARSRETSERWGRRWRTPLRPRPGLHIKSGRRGGCSSGAVGGGGGGAPLRSRSSRLSSAVEAHSPPSLAAALRGLPAGTMRGRDFPLILLALVLCQAPRGPAAPVSAGGGTLLAKMYPRGNHWAVGECPARSSPAGTSQPRGPVSPSLSFSAALRWGLGFAPTFPLRRQPRSPKTPPCPSVSREAVGPSAASGWSLGPFPLSSLPPQDTRASAQLSKIPAVRGDHPPSASPSTPFYPSNHNPVWHCSLPEQFWGAGSPSASRSPGPAWRLRLYPRQSHRCGTRGAAPPLGFKSVQQAAPESHLYLGLA